MAQSFSLKLIDISGVNEDPFKLKEVASLIKQECMTTGFFLLKMPDGIKQFIPSVIEAAKQFFKLPSNEKQKLINSVLTQMKVNGQSIPGTGSGYRGVSEDANFKSDTRESYNMGPDITISAVTSKGYSGSGMTPWPEEGLLPGWKKIMQDYTNEVLSTVVPSLRKVFAVSLGLDENYFEQPGYFDMPTWLLGLTYYFPERSDASLEIYGIRPHCDSGMFTLLIGDGKPGLQVCLDKSVDVGKRVWLDVQIPPQGYFVVNIGQVLERWSGGSYKATMHRVMLDGTTDRLSIPFFYDPNIDLKIIPLVASDAGKVTNYKPESLGQIMLDRLEKHSEDFE
ncbi:uncharacterized protein LOC135681699 [Rhopilema esculentum]|uniref:uncharacterized protein LOC135681699 n=1 Tax=Rhopilema esculentum TaxID=499914 RepID=UPI0031D73F6A|eukprot:gene13239-4065_t